MGDHPWVKNSQCTKDAYQLKATEEKCYKKYGNEYDNEHDHKNIDKQHKCLCDSESLEGVRDECGKVFHVEGGAYNDDQSWEDYNKAWGKDRKCAGPAEDGHSSEGDQELRRYVCSSLEGRFKGANCRHYEGWTDAWNPETRKQRKRRM